LAYEKEIDLPWGTFQVNLLYKKKDANEGDDGYELAELNEEWIHDFFVSSVEPKPVSQQKQKELDDEEER